MAVEYTIRVGVPEGLEERQAVVWIRRLIVGLETGGFGVKVERVGPPVGKGPEPVASSSEPYPGMVTEIPLVEDEEDEDL